jgi:nicotinamidase-related amidase
VIVTDNLRSRALLSRQTSRLLIVDVQSKLLRLVQSPAALEDACRRLIDAATLLGIPVSATEQYPKGLGRTVESLMEGLGNPVEKLRFSSVPSLDWMNDETHGGRHQIVIAGMETHVCIMQTALDLVARGFDVHLPADAVSARKTLDHDTALRRMQAEGCTITTWESVLFEWCETAEAAEFKAISKLVVQPPRQVT